MLIHDLQTLVDHVTFLDTLKSKLNNTFVQQSGVWQLCRVMYDMESIENEIDNIPDDVLSLYDGHAEQAVSIDNIHLINTEPEWPEAGRYTSPKGGDCIVSYNKTKAWKAGLPTGLIRIETSGGLILDTYDMVRVLNDMVPLRRTVKDGIQLMVDNMTSDVALCDSLSLHRNYGENKIHLIFDESPVVAYVTTNGVVSIKEEYKYLTELLEHEGVI